MPDAEKAPPYLAAPSVTEKDSFGDFLMHLAITFVNILPENIEEEINRALAMTGKFTHVDRAYVMSYDFSDKTVANTHEWCAEGIEPMIHHLQCVPMEGLEEEWLDVHLRGEIVHVPSVRELPASGALRLLLEPQGISTLVAVPMTYREQCLGFVGFDAVGHHVDWTTEQLTLVRMLAELFTNAEMSRRRTQALRDEQFNHKRMRLLLQKAVDAAGIAVWELERNGKGVNMVSGWNRLLGVGWDGREIELGEFKGRVHEEDLGRVEAVVAGFGGDSPDSKSLEYRLRGEGGDWRHLRAWWVEDAEGANNQVRMYGGTMDVSDTHLRSEAQLLLNRISSRFVDLESHEQALARSMPEIAGFCFAKAAEIILIDDLPEGLCGPWTAGHGKHRDHLEQVWAHIIGKKEIMRRLAGGIPMVSGADGAAEPMYLSGTEGRPPGADSIIWMPLRVGGALKGVIAVMDPGFGKRTSLLHVDFLGSCAEVIAGALGRAQAEWTLLDNVKRKQVILNSLKQVIFLTDSLGRITFINQAGSAFCGEPTSSIIGRQVAEALNPLSRSSLSFFTPPFGTEQSLVCPTVGLGKSRTLQLSRILLADNRETSSGVLGIINDITEQRAWESHLISQKIQAESSSKDKTLYISSLSHELRTPMHGVLGMLELMVKSGKLDSANNDLAASAQRSGRDLLRLFDDLLEIAKLESGAVQIHPGEIDLRKMLDDMLFPFRKESARRGIAFHLVVSDGIPDRIIIDDLRLRQIIGNLVSNAVKYTDSGSVRLTLDMEGGAGTCSAGGGKRMRLAVEDTGIGIDERDIGLLFNPFVKINPGRNRSVEGSGLGLSITRELVNLLHGEISIHSEPGVGTSATVFLPLDLPARQEHAPAGSLAADECYGALRGLSILVAEDNMINRMLASEHLSSLGCHVTTVENGMEAVRECGIGAFDFVIMDLSMPVMNGFEAAKTIIAESRSHAAPVIIGCTADSSEHAVTRCLEAGMRSVILKPFTRDELARILKSFVPVADLPGNRKAPAANPSSMDAMPPIFDEAVFRALESGLSGNLAALDKILDLFRDDSLRKIADIREAIGTGDLALLSRTAHSLKGSSSSLGAARLSALCASLEDACGALLQGTAGDAVLIGTSEDLLIEFSAFLDFMGNVRNLPRGD
jgi:signal transduction histidine kinase/HPt (histidine-containing phosphotransfer) domain-containing protein